MKNLTQNELDTLAQAYLDCRLSRLEEKELELVLYSTNISTPAIDEARQIMGISTLMAAAPRPRQLQMKRRRFAPVGWAAAVIGLLFFSSLFYFKGVKLGDTSGTEQSIAVYVDGERLTGDEALAEVRESRNENMAMVRELMNEVHENYNQNMNYIN